jgi:hypothetical protein
MVKYKFAKSPPKGMEGRRLIKGRSVLILTAGKKLGRHLETGMPII